MIVIGNPSQEWHNGLSYVTVNIVEENNSRVLYYAVNEEYGQFQSCELVDPFLVGILLYAIRNNQDIKVQGNISSRLGYNLKTIIYVLSASFGYNTINVTYNGLIENSFESTAVGCGCSLGVDSLSAIIHNLSDECPDSYRITHLTYFNVGAMGYKNLQIAKESYNKDLIFVKKYAQYKNLPLICIESNIPVYMEGFDFDQCGLICNMGAALSLPKLFSKYLYASDYLIKETHLSSKCLGYIAPLLLPLLSTNSTELVLVDTTLSRSQKTEYISDTIDAQENLYVCWKEVIVNKNPNSPISKIKDKFRNCTRCDKCLRTILTLDILGKLDKFSNLFDVRYYKEVKNKYIAKIYLYKKRIHFMQIYMS